MRRGATATRCSSAPRSRSDQQTATIRTVTIVGVDEIDTAKGRVSWISPVAKALLKAREGDTVTLKTPGGVEALEILEVQLRPNRLRSRRMSIVREFREFAVKGNVMDLAVGVIIGAAFGKIVGSLVEDVVMPVIGTLIGGVDFSGLALKVGSATLKYGKFLQTCLDFLIIAWAIFLDRQADQPPEARGGRARPGAAPRRRGRKRCWRKSATC